MGNHRMDRFGTEGVLGLLIRETELERSDTRGGRIRRFNYQGSNQPPSPLRELGSSSSPKKALKFRAAH